MRRTASAVAAAAVLALTGGPANADPAGRTTLEETIGIGAGGGFRALERRRGEPFLVRQDGLGRAQRGRNARRRSLVFFGQVTDPQLADEMSPARADFLDPAGDPLSAAHRPQEAFEPQVFDQIVRNINRNRTSRVAQAGGRRQRLEFAITTGDLVDNQQLNEARWYVGILNGGRIDPFSGKPIGPGNPCPQANAEQTQRLNDDVANRRYTGVQDYDDYPGEPEERYRGFWDPDVPPPGGGPYASFPRHAGLMERAQRPFTAEGLRVPWFTARGNHDGLALGNIATSHPVIRALSTSCMKPFPTRNVDPAEFSGTDEQELVRRVNDPQFLQRVLSGSRPVPPDPDRRFVSVAEFKRLHGRGTAHGYAFVDRGELRASAGVASYYAFTPKRGFRFVSLDTVAEGGGQYGNLDHAQYRWLERELDRNSSTEYGRGGRLVRDRDPNQLIVVYGHHDLNDLRNTNEDERAGACRDAADPGCDRDPRRSRPIHRGLAGPSTIRDLLLRFPNVIALVAGHSHENEVDRILRRDRRGGFWEITTASHIDYPQQSRLIEVMDNRDGTLSLFNTVLDHAAPIGTVPSGFPGASLSDVGLASLGRRLSANDPQGKGVGTDTFGGGNRLDRNLELMLSDPRRFWRAPARGR